VYSDPGADPLPAKIARNKPADVKDTCYASAAQGGPQDDLFCTGTPAQWQYFGHMRWVAGWPMTLDHYKCQLKPLDPLDYRLPDNTLIQFTEEEWGKLQQAFPDGVCDFSKPAVNQQPSLPWVTFAAGPGGEPLGDVPVSKAIPVSTRLLEQLALVAALDDKQANSFLKQLESTIAQLDAGQIKAACGSLGAYMKHVNAQSGKHLEAALAEDLLLDAGSIYADMGCTLKPAPKPAT
jgi:hypothetical protein